MSRFDTRSAFWILWSLWLVLKLVLAASLDLFGDEAFYAWESRHPAAAYTDIPALTAWLMAVGREFFGDHPLAVRLPFVLLGAWLPFLVRRLARRWVGDADAWHAALLTMAIPIFATLGVLALPDVPLLVLAVLALDAFDRALARDGLRDWLETGTWVALGLYTHYRFLVPVAAALLVLSLSPRARPAWRRPGLWLAFAIVAVALWPQFSFHVDTGGVGLGFQFVERHPWSFQWQGLLHLPLQALVTTPLIYLGLLLALLLVAVRSPAGVPRDLALAFSGVPIAVYLAGAFFADGARTHAHWPAIGYLALLPVLAAAWRRETVDWPRRWRRVAGAGALMLGCAATMLAFGYLALAARAPWSNALAEHKAFPANFTGWSEAAQRARSHLAQPAFADADLLADNFMLAAQLDFHFGPQHTPFVLDHARNHFHGRAAQLALWGRDEASWLRDGRMRALLVIEDTALSLRERPAWYHVICARIGGMRMIDELSLFGGRRRFLFYEIERGRAGCDLPALGYIDLPVGASVPRDRPFDIEGWAFKDGAGIREVRVLLDGRELGSARYGLPFPGVRALWPFSTDPAHPDVGFAARLDLSAQSAGRHRLGLRLLGRDGSVRDFPEQSIDLR